MSPPRGSKNCWRPTYTLGPFKCNIKLDDEVLRPPSAITGCVTLINPQDKSICHHGILVHLEAIVKGRHVEKGGRGGIYTTSKSLLDVPGDVSDYATHTSAYLRYTYSPIRQNVVMTNCRPFTTDTICLQGHVKRPAYITKPGEKLTFPFRLEFPSNMHSLPAPFTDKFGRLTYVVAAYLMFRTIQHDFGGERVMKFGGYNSLNQDVTLLPPLKHESGFKKSFLSGENSVTATFNVENGEGGGFLPGESVLFTLTLENPKGFMVMEMAVAFLKKVKHKFETGGNLKKEVGERLVSLSLHTGSCNAVTILKEGSLMIPEGVGVTYTGSENYSVTFHLQYEVKLAEFGRPLGGFVDINVGSDRFGEGRRGSFLVVDVGATARIRSSSFNGVPERGGQTARNSDRLVRINRNSTAGLPGQLLPSYSQLFPRSNSLETLPPHYDDLCFE